MENAKIARCAYSIISKIGGTKELLLLFQACSCLLILVVNPSHVITCRRMSIQDIVLTKYDLNIPNNDDIKLSKESNENLCTYKHNDTFVNRFLFLVIGLMVITFIQVRSRIATTFLRNRISRVNLLNCVLTSYALIGLSKYFIFPQLNSILYGYSSIFQLLLSPLKLIMTCILVVVGFPLSLFYRYSRVHLFDIPKTKFVDLVFSPEMENYRSAFDAVPDEILSVNCGNVCWSVFKWSNLFLLTLHIIACALLINKENSSDDVNSTIKTDYQCRTCLNQKNADKLTFLPYHDDVTKNDIRNKFSTKPVNVIKPMNVSPTLRKKKVKVESSTQTIEDTKESRRNSVKKRISEFEGTIRPRAPSLSNSVFTQTCVSLSHKSIQTADVTTELNMVDKVTQTDVPPRVRKPSKINKSIQVKSADLKVFKTCATSTLETPLNSSSTQTDMEQVDTIPVNKKHSSVSNSIEIFERANLTVNNRSMVDNCVPLHDKHLSNGTEKEKELINEKRTTCDNGYDNSTQTIDKTYSSIATSAFIDHNERSVQTKTTEILQCVKSSQTNDMKKELKEKYIQTNDMKKELKDKYIQASCTHLEIGIQTSNDIINCNEISTQTEFHNTLHHTSSQTLAVEERAENLSSVSVEAMSLTFSEESLPMECFDTTGESIEELEGVLSVHTGCFSEEKISVRSLESGFVDDSDEIILLEETSTESVVEESVCHTITITPLINNVVVENTTRDQGIQITSQCQCNKDYSSRMNKRTQTSSTCQDKSIQVYSLRSDRRDTKPPPVVEDEILYSSRDSLYFDCDDHRETYSSNRKSVISIGTNTEEWSVSEIVAQTTDVKEVKVSHSNMDVECPRAYYFDEKELKELEFREIENIYKVLDKKPRSLKLNKSTQIDFLKVRETLNDISSCYCQKENIGNTVYSLMTSDEQMFNIGEPIKFKAKKSSHGIWYVCLRGDVFLTVCQEVLSNIHLLSEIENITRYVADDILNTMKAFIENYTRLSVCFDDDCEESDDESFINGFRL